VRLVFAKEKIYFWEKTRRKAPANMSNTTVSMDLIVPKENIKIFSSMLLCMSKISEHVNIQLIPGHRTLKLYCVDSAQSAFLEFNLSSKFFKEFDLRRNVHEIHIAVSLKHFLNVFHFVGHIDHLRLHIPSANDFLHIECTQNKTKLRKRVRLYFNITDAQRATYNQECYIAHMVDNKKLIRQCLSNFPSSIRDISFCIERKIGNGAEGSNCSPFNDYLIKMKTNPDYDTAETFEQVMTELTFGINHFIYVDIKRPTIESMKSCSSFKFEEVMKDIISNTNQKLDSKTQFPSSLQILEMTFNFKDFKSFINFCSNAGQPVHIHLAKQGNPILLKCNSEQRGNDIQAICLLATVDDGYSYTHEKLETFSAISKPVSEPSLTAHTCDK
jgi:hypothetical protein